LTKLQRIAALSAALVGADASHEALRPLVKTTVLEQSVTPHSIDELAFTEDPGAAALLLLSLSLVSRIKREISRMLEGTDDSYVQTLPMGSTNDER
jgi:hypothetical protein